MKYVVVTGGVVSGLGKGITISSIGRILKASGLRVTSIKIDPYLNVDAGTMSPFEHGEVFVLDDGGEADLDLGNYERFLDLTLTKDHNITTGKMYGHVLEKERKGDYLGKTVQVVPHVTDCIQEWIERVALIPTDGNATGLPADVCLVEVGGTVGDIESMVFLEALRQFQFRVGRDNFCLVHVSLVPVLGAVGEQKTKPTQHGVKELRSVGLSPDLLICRSTDELEESTKRKLAAFCHVSPDHVLSVHDVSNIYHVPLILVQQKINTLLLARLALATTPAGAPPPPPPPVVKGGATAPVVAPSARSEPDLRAWSEMAHEVDNFEEEVNIALVGKYTGLQDSYLSVLKALKHGSIEAKRRLVVHWVESSDLEPASASSDGGAGNDDVAASAEKRSAAWAVLESSDGVVVPGGFGNRGVEGKIATARHCREAKKPYLGVCLGMQMLVVEYARSVLGWEGANSTEFDKETAHPTIIFMPEGDKERMGGTMRLGARDTVIDGSGSSGAAGAKGGAAAPSLTAALYACAGTAGARVSERHRHRYEVNPEKVEALEAAGLRFVGRDTTGERMEVVELDRATHPFYVGAQYHPEFKSRPLAASPPFLGLVLAASGLLEDRLANGTAAVGSWAHPAYAAARANGTNNDARAAAAAAAGAAKKNAELNGAAEGAAPAKKIKT